MQSPYSCRCSSKFSFNYYFHFSVISFIHYLNSEVFSLIMLLELIIMWSSNSNFSVAQLEPDPVLIWESLFMSFLRLFLSLFKALNYATTWVLSSWYGGSWSFLILSVLVASFILSTILWSLLPSWRGLTYAFVGYCRQSLYRNSVLNKGDPVAWMEASVFFDFCSAILNTL